MSIFDKLSNLIFEEDSENTPKKPQSQKKGKFSDIFFEEEAPTDEKSKKEKG